MKDVKIRGDLTTKDITRDLAAEILDVKKDSLMGSFPGQFKPNESLATIDPPEGLTPEESYQAQLEAIGEVWQQQNTVNNMRDQIVDHIRHGKFRIAEMGSEIIGFAMAKDAHSDPLVAARRFVFRTSRPHKLDSLYMRQDFQDTSGINSPVVELGKKALEGIDPGNRVVSFAAEEDWFTPAALFQLGIERFPVVQKPREITSIFGEENPLHVYKYESRFMTDRA